MKSPLVRIVASIWWLSLTIGDALLIQWLWWHGPDWVHVRGMPELSPVIWVPMGLFGIISLIWSIGHVFNIECSDPNKKHFNLPQ